jgi:hypothetical protein
MVIHVMPYKYHPVHFKPDFQLKSETIPRQKIKIIRANLTREWQAPLKVKQTLIKKNNKN